MTAIQQKGTIAALDFCNVQAIPLTNSMSTHYNAVIKRVSDRNRNPNINQTQRNYITSIILKN